MTGKTKNSEKLVCFDTKYPLFTPTKLYKYSFLNDKKNFSSVFNVNDNIALPIHFDTEYTSTEPFIGFVDGFKNVNITCQIKHTHHNDAIIFTYPEFVEHSNKPSRHKILEYPLVLGDYLKHAGLEVIINRRIKLTTLKNKLPTLLIVVYGHFLLADWIRFATDPKSKYANDIKQKYVSGRIKMFGRLMGEDNNFEHMPWTIEISGNTYTLAFKFCDTIGIHGKVSLATAAENVGVPMQHKTSLDEYKTCMDIAYYKLPDDFDKYAIGDLKSYEIVENTTKMSSELYDNLGLAGFFNTQKMTVGAALNKLVVSKHYNAGGLTPADVSRVGLKKGDFGKFTNEKEFFSERTGLASPAHFAANTAAASFSLHKILGGRCHSNQPTLTKMCGRIVDTDIKGAYGNIMSRQPVFWGNPVLLTIQGDKQGIPLKTIIKHVGKFLKPLSWVIKFNAHNLNFSQDLFSSWFDYNENKNNDDDGYRKEILEDESKGTSRIFTHQINEGVLTSDTLQIVDFGWTNAKQRNDFYDKSLVTSIAFYHIDYEIAVTEYNNLKTSTASRRAFETPKKLEKLGMSCSDQHFNEWTTVPIGTELIQKLTIMRSNHPKKSPKNNFCKLNINTIYGATVCDKFFAANAVVGNNITSSARAHIYLVEKALMMIGSVTDGHVFDIDRVFHPIENCVPKTEFFPNLHRMSNRELHDNKIGVIKPLNISPNANKIMTRLFENIGDKFCLDTADPEYNILCESINQSCFDHILSIFPNVPMLKDTFFKQTTVNGETKYVKLRGAFTLELKNIVPNVWLHAKSNYSYNPEIKGLTKYRGYERKLHFAIGLDEQNKKFILLDDYKFLNPAETLFQQIKTNPDNVRLLPPYIKPVILKDKEFKKRHDKYWSKTNYGVGHTYLKRGQINYCSLHYQFKTLEQFKSWESCSTKLHKKYSATFEIYFTNYDGTIRYQEMLHCLDRLINDGVTNPLKDFFHAGRRENVNVHQQYKKRLDLYDKMKNQIDSHILIDD